MVTITLTQEEYKQKMFESYKEGFQAAIEALKYSFAAIDELRPTLRAPDFAYCVCKSNVPHFVEGFCVDCGLPEAQSG